MFALSTVAAVLDGDDAEARLLEGAGKISTVFMVCGNTAAGKSTYAIQLAQAQNAVLFSLDPWMQNLYGADAENGNYNWLLERTERCRAQIKETAGQLIRLGIPVVLDLGFGDINARTDFRQWAAALGADVSLHFLDVPAEERRERVRRRNLEKGETFAFEVTDAMFDYIENMFEPPSEEELIGGVRVVLI